MSRNDSWMPLHVGDYAADTGHLCDAEHGAYLLLIMHYWRTGPLPDDDARLARIACASDPKRWGKTIGPVVRAFFRSEDGVLRHKRIDAERAKAQQISSKRANAARASHAQRSSKPDANAEQMQSKSTASATHARTELQPQKQKEDSEANASGAKAPDAPQGDLLAKPMPPDARRLVWGEGLERLTRLTGKPHAAARRILGKLLSDAGDDAAGLLAALRDCPVTGDPLSWLTVAAKRCGAREPTKGAVARDAPPEAWAAYDGGNYEIWGAAEQVCQAARIPDPEWRGDWATLDGWLCDGLDLHAVILPAIKRVAGRPNYQPPSSLRFFDGAVRSRVAVA